MCYSLISVLSRVADLAFWQFFISITLESTNQALTLFVFLFHLDSIKSITSKKLTFYFLTSSRLWRNLYNCMWQKMRMCMLICSWKYRFWCILNPKMVLEMSVVCTVLCSLSEWTDFDQIWHFDIFWTNRKVFLFSIIRIKFKVTLFNRLRKHFLKNINVY